MNALFKRMNTLTLLKTVVVILMAVGIATSVLLIMNDIWSVGAIIALVVFVLLGVVGVLAVSRYSKEIAKITAVLNQGANGVLYHRVTHIDTTEEIGTLAWSLNNLLDQFEAFSRDMDTSLKLISQGKSHRRMLPKGLHGDFVRLSNNINKALETIAVAQSKDESIQKMLCILNEYTNGVYTSQIDLAGMQDDIVSLAKGINDLGDALSKLSQVNLKNGLALKQDSEVLAQNVQKLSEASKQQAASLEETSAALDEITSGMQKSSQNTASMSNYANEVTNAANEGESMAKKTAQAMDEINTQTNDIMEAITVIDQIAFQTNILSLNAAVEAATAGEAGKGFAVVAGEVRNLASRSAEAAKEIKDIVEQATLKANDGKDVAHVMIQGYGKLNDHISSTKDLIDEVARSTKEQEQSIVQINDAIASLDKQTQQNAHIAHETNIVAQQSHDIAEKIVKEANKEFEGKDQIKLRKKIIDPNYKGPERRSIERRIKNNEF